MEVLVILSTVLLLTFTASSVCSIEIPSTIRKKITNCLISNDTVTCLSVKGIMALNRAALIPKIEILPGLSIKRDSTTFPRSVKAISEHEIIDSLPSEETERSGRLFDLAMNSLITLIDSHSLEIKFPKESTQAFARAIEKERHKVKKGHHKLGGLALALALKALLLAAYALWKKLCQGHKGHGALIKYVDNGSAHAAANAAQTDLNPGTAFAEQYPYTREYSDSAQDLAYNGYGI